MLRLFIVFKASNLCKDWMEHGPSDAIYKANPSGWFDRATFEEYFELVIVLEKLFEKSKGR